MTELVARGATILGFLAAAAVALAMPESLLLGGLAWLVALAFSASGWGYIALRLAGGGDVDFGLRALWGIAALLAVAGFLVALGVLVTPVLLGLVALGLAAAGVREWITPAPLWRTVLSAMRRARAHPELAVLIVLGAAVLLALVAGGVARLDRNPWDDDIAYTPLVKRLLDRGDLEEPFMLRRLSAYGGQTVLGALAAARGSLANVHLADRGLCLLLVALAMLGHARERGAPPLWVGLLVVLLLTLPETSINTAAHYSGLALFIALYRTLAVERWALAALVGAALCTLRQSYIVVVGLLVLLVLASHVARAVHESSWSIARRAWQRRVLTCATVAGIALAGWWVAAYASSGTILFPVFPGTFNHHLPLSPVAGTLLEELQFFVMTALDARPLVIVPVLFVLLLFVRDTRPGRPLTALFVATSVGFGLLVHAFAGSESFHLWRYHFAPGIALFLVLVVEAAGARRELVVVPSLGRWLLLAAVLLQLVVQQSGTRQRYVEAFADLRDAAALGRNGDPVATSERERYRRLQATVPPGAALAVMLDDPAHLDFARNEIANLDTPGYASPGGAIPVFAGADAVRAYFVQRGIHHVAFIRGERSRYAFRRSFWVWRIVNDGELFQAMSAYTIAFIDAFAELATRSRVLHDADGLVAIELDATAAAPPLPSEPEPVQRDRFTFQLAQREGIVAAWSLNNRREVSFVDGLSSLVVLDRATADEPRWHQVGTPSVATVGELPREGTPVRWMSRRVHVRVRADGARQLRLRGRVNLAAVRTRPRLDIVLDGVVVGTAVVDERGYYQLALDVPVLAREWHDMFLIWNSVAEPGAEPRDTRVARLEVFDWVVPGATR